MSTYNFHLLVNQHGERFIFYKSPNGEKIIEDFAKIPYSAERLFEDITDEFSAFPWSDRSYKISDKELAVVMVGAEAIYAELYTLQMNDNEKTLFVEFQDYLVTYCQDNDMELCIWDEAIEKAQ